MTACNLLARILSQRALQAELAANPRPCAFRAADGVRVIHRNTHPGKVGDWRVTSIPDDEAAELTHVEAGPSFNDALTLARTDGADLSDEVMEAVL